MHSLLLHCESSTFINMANMPRLPLSPLGRHGPLQWHAATAADGAGVDGTAQVASSLVKALQGYIDSVLAAGSLATADPGETAAQVPASHAACGCVCVGARPFVLQTQSISMGSMQSTEVVMLDGAVHVQLSLAAEVVIKACILVSRLDILWDDVFPRFQVLPAVPWLYDLQYWPL